MKYLDLTWADAGRNLACDEALLDCFEQARDGTELLRLWAPANYFVVLGHGNPWRTEAAVEACLADGIPILRRCSGGGTILQGPGCLNYSLILRQDNFLSDQVQAAFDFVLQRHRRCLEGLSGAPVLAQGMSDLTLGGRKFSGNAQYRKRHYVLVHGTFLLNFDLSCIGKYLPMPARQPDYRRQRGHDDFLVNLRLDAVMLGAALRKVWRADEAASAVPEQAIERLLAERYGRAEWNEKF